MSVGDVIPPQYDSMIAKIIAWGRDRPEALARLRVRAAGHHRGPARRDDDQVLPARPARPAGGRGRHRGHRLAGPHRDRGGHRGRAGGVAWRWPRWRSTSSDAEERREREAFLASARGGRPRSRHEVEPHAGARLPRPGLPPDGREGRPATGTASSSTAATSTWTWTGSARWRARLTVGDERFSVVAVEAPGSHLVEVDGVSHRVTRDAGGVVHAPAPSVVVALRVQAGQDVEAGQTVAVLESMKMETAVRAPFAGRVRELLARANSQVDAGAALLSLERAGDDVEEVSGERVEFPGTDAAPRQRPPGQGPVPARGAAGTDHRLRRQRPLRPAAGGRVRRRPRRGPRGRRRTAARRAHRPHHLRRPLRAVAEPAGQRGGGGRRSRSTARGSTSTPTCTPSTSSARACRRASGAGSPGRCCTTGSTTSSRAPGSRRR